jgi:hypothetical protein
MTTTGRLAISMNVLPVHCTAEENGKRTSAIVGFVTIADVLTNDLRKQAQVMFLKCETCCQM